MEADDQVLTSIDYFYKNSAFPQTYQEAKDSPESRNWEAAVNEEMNSRIEDNTFTLCNLPEGKNSVGGWVGGGGGVSWGIPYERKLYWC